MSRFLKEPLLHFLLLGGALFALFSFMGTDDGIAADDSANQGSATARFISKDITVTQGQIESFIAQFTKVWQRSPTEKELKGLIDQYIREEVMYRQALELELDKDDALVRRRMRQKLEFMTEDISSLSEPTEQDLTKYLEAKPKPYRLESKLTFKQVYLDSNKRKTTIDSDVQALLTSLRAAGASADISQLGDRLMIEQAYTATSQRDIARIFGKEFSWDILKLETGSWQEPIRSGFGLHLIYISERIDGRPPKLSEVRDAVARDWSSMKRKKDNEAIYEKWRNRYTVTVEKITERKDSPAE
tara:strand:+ start:7316 stop:8221 length:906 start_codon:yes stop_codon:yes gene_type:complete